MQTTRSETQRTARSSVQATPSASAVEAPENDAGVTTSTSTRPRTVGTPIHWAVQGAVFGGLVGCLAPAYLLLVLAVAYNTEAVVPIWFFWPFGVAGAALGGALGLVQPALLDRVRGRVPLPALALLQGAVGASAGALLLGAAFLTLESGLLGWELLQPMGIAAAVGGVMAALAWLPITVATVLRVPTLPVTLALAAGVPTALLLLALGWLNALPAAPILLGL